MKLKSTIVLHDSFAFKGGGERLIHNLCQELGLDLAFGTCSDFSYDLSQLPGKCIHLKADSDIWGWRTLNRLRAFRIKTKFLRNYRNVIFSGHNAPLAVHNHESGKNIYYCHTLPRSLYDLEEYHLSTLPPGRVFSHKIFNRMFRPVFESAIGKMDRIIANSRFTQKRIKDFLGKSSSLVYPPCDTKVFQWIGQGNYYLSTARLTHLKRVDLIIKAFLETPEKKLIVTSTGPEMANLMKLAEGKTNIVFTGLVDDTQLKDLVGNSIATIYIPKEEDFGISPIESMAAGKPVLGVAEGGLLETILPEATGLLIKKNPSTVDIIQGIEKLNAKRALAMREACEKRAHMFRKEIFLEKMKQLIEN